MKKEKAGKRQEWVSSQWMNSSCYKIQKMGAVGMKAWGASQSKGRGHLLMSNLSVLGWDSGMPQRDGGLSSRGQRCWRLQGNDNTVWSATKRPCGAEGQKEGVKVRTQEDRAGKMR